MVRFSSFFKISTFCVGTFYVAPRSEAEIYHGEHRSHQARFISQSIILDLYHGFIRLAGKKVLIENSGKFTRKLTRKKSFDNCVKMKNGFSSVTRVEKSLD